MNFSFTLSCGKSSRSHFFCFRLVLPGQQHNTGPQRSCLIPSLKIQTACFFFFFANFGRGCSGLLSKQNSLSAHNRVGLLSISTPLHSRVVVHLIFPVITSRLTVAGRLLGCRENLLEDGFVGCEDVRHIRARGRKPGLGGSSVVCFQLFKIFIFPLH